MRKVSGRRLVLDKHPKARIEKHKPNFGKAYFLIRLPHESREHDWRQMWSGCGDSPSRAWNDAAERLGLRKESV